MCLIESDPRAHLGCGVVPWGREGQFVAAGGWSDFARSTVEIYNVATDTWRVGEWYNSKLSFQYATLLIQYNPDSTYPDSMFYRLVRFYQCLR